MPHSTAPSTASRAQRDRHDFRLLAYVVHRFDLRLRQTVVEPGRQLLASRARLTNGTTLQLELNHPDLRTPSDAEPFLRYLVTNAGGAITYEVLLRRPKDRDDWTTSLTKHGDAYAYYPVVNGEAVGSSEGFDEGAARTIAEQLVAFYVMMLRNNSVLDSALVATPQHSCFDDDLAAFNRLRGLLGSPEMLGGPVRLQRAPNGRTVRGTRQALLCARPVQHDDRTLELELSKPHRTSATDSPVVLTLRLKHGIVPVAEVRLVGERDLEDWRVTGWQRNASETFLEDVQVATGDTWLSWIAEPKKVDAVVRRLVARYHTFGAPA